MRAMWSLPHLGKVFMIKIIALGILLSDYNIMSWINVKSLGVTEVDASHTS